jgi:hypothetical protein
VQRGHAPGHERGSIGHANRRRCIEAVKSRAARRQAIDIWRPYHLIAIAVQMIGAVLVGDDEKETGSFVHEQRIPFVASVYHNPPLLQCVRVVSNSVFQV